MRLLLPVLVSTAWLPAAPAADVSYVRDIKPILATACYECHGPDKAKAGLRLDSPEAITKGSRRSAVLVPGDPAKSPLYTLTILAKDHEDIMPAKGEPLTKVQTELIRAWIAAGAAFDDDGKTPGKKPEARSGKPDKTSQVVPDAPAPAPLDANDPRYKPLLAAGMVLQPSPDGLLVNASHIPGGVTEDQLRTLGKLGPGVAHLDLASSGITDRQVNLLAPLTGLKRLHLERNPELGDAAIAALAKQDSAPALEYLNLYGTKVGDAALPALAKFTDLEALYLWQSQVTPAGLEKLRQILPECRIESAPSDLPSQPLAKANRSSKGKKKK